MKYFKDLDLEILRDTTVILDIDGTIVYDKGVLILENEQTKLIELKNIARRVVLVSNGGHSRTEEMAVLHDVVAHVSPFKKPSGKIWQALADEGHYDAKEKVVVVGDKFVTDGLFALRSSVPFIHVKSLQEEKSSLYNRFVFFVDDVIGKSFELLRLMRPQQWLKNLLVFAPAFFAGVIFNKILLIDSMFAFIVFSISASLVYVLNDINDIQADREHERKRWRPLSSTNISVREGVLLAIFLTVITIAILAYVPHLVLIIAVYILANIIYTLKLKHIPVFDVILVASMYVMRVMAGGFVTGLFISPWIIACTFFASLFLISCKRYAEFKNPVRQVLKRYTKESLTGLLIVSANLAVISYVIYTILGTHIKNAIYSAPFVLAIFLIMLNDIFNGEKRLETPEVYLFKNRHIRIALLGWIVCMYILVYSI